MQTVEVFTDGSAKGNPGPGGAAAIMRSGTLEKELVQGFRLTTNNRMELLAVIMALEALKRTGLNVNIYSDSKYVVEAFNSEEGVIVITDFSSLILPADGTSTPEALPSFSHAIVEISIISESSIFHR